MWFCEPVDVFEFINLKLNDLYFIFFQIIYLKMLVDFGKGLNNTINYT